MPLVHIDLIEGRSPEQLKALVKDVTDAIVKESVPGHRREGFNDGRHQRSGSLTRSGLF